MAKVGRPRLAGSKQRQELLINTITIIIVLAILAILGYLFLFKGTSLF